MKKLRMILISIIIVLGAMFLVNLGESYAADRTLNITRERPYNDDNGDSTIGNDKYDLKRNAKTYFVVKIFDTTTTGYPDAFYCLRGGLGFGSDSATPNDVTYTKRGDMFEKNTSTGKYIVLEDYYKAFLTNMTDAEAEANYNSILWIIDNMYLPRHINTEDGAKTDTERAEMKEKLLRAAGIWTDAQPGTVLTDDDIEVIQQVAIWQLSNADELADATSVWLPTNALANLLKINQNGTNYGDVASNTGDISGDRATQINQLYQYLVNTAKMEPAPEPITEPTINIEDTDSTIVEKKLIAAPPHGEATTGGVSYYLAGPFEITGTGDINKVDIKFDTKIKYKTDGNLEEITEMDNRTGQIFISNASGESNRDKQLEDMINAGQFYIAINKALNPDLQDFSLGYSYTYTYWQIKKAEFWDAGLTNQPVVLVEKEKKTGGGDDSTTVEDVSGQLNLNIKKVDEEGNLILSEAARFTLKRMPSGTPETYYTTDNGLQTGVVTGEINVNNIEIKNNGEEFIYEIEETDAPKGYTKFSGKFYIKITTEKVIDTYKIKEAYFTDSAGNKLSPEPTDLLINISADKTKVTLIVPNQKIKEYDLALRKFITKVTDSENATNYNREPNVDVAPLQNGEDTAIYTHDKTPILIKTGDKVTYTIRVYNEGEIDGKALEITDYLPVGLKLSENSTINTTYGWVADGTGRVIKTDYLKNTVIPAFNKTTGEIKYADLEIECDVIATEGSLDKTLRNIAEITEDDGDDTDSTPNDVDLDNYNPPSDNSEYQEDDDDYEDLVLPGKEFDLALRKFITKINENVLTGESSREPKIDLSKLRDRTAKTATYTHTKEPVVVKQGDIVTYTIRVYNEGDRDGYAKEITDYLPEGLGLLKDYKTNFDNEWKLPSNLPEGSKVVDLVGENGLYKNEQSVKNLKAEDFEGIDSLKDVQIVGGKVPITTNMLERDSAAPNENIIKAYNPKTKQSDVETGNNWQQTSEQGQTDGLYYKEVQVTCIVLAENTYPDVIRNIAEINHTQDENGNDNDNDDRDSNPGNVDIDNYNPPSDNSDYQQDDDDYEQLILKYFDLALKKFITKVTENKSETNYDREPTVTIPDDFETDLEYTFPKDKEKNPVEVANGNIVTYTIRVYNEGTIDGYAEEIKDNIPEGLEFLPDNSTNKKYEWEMYYKDENGNSVPTNDPLKATEVRTDYLSSSKESEARQNELKAFDISKGITDTNPDYKDVEIAFKVTYTEDKEHSGRIIINTAEISKDSDDDSDSIPDNNKDGEDDIDKEYIYVKYFDLSLIKWVSKAIVTVDGKTTTTNYTMPKDDPGSEYLVKIPLDKKKINSATVKIAYTIKIINEGEIEGYATEITDYIPKGLEYYTADNKVKWEKSGENEVTTRALEKTLLKPGESAEVELVLRWKRSGENLGVKTNIAEISEDYNEYGSKDIDSTPGNKVPEEDDQDFAKTILERVTGGSFVYIPVIGIVLTILAGGLILIKKYVL